ncbi:MAG: Xaa-Pro dipeptidase [Chromatiales bacterium]|nr:MAG: Xaa-Pro dipeptidase [Chromatiales bacterium]
MDKQILATTYPRHLETVRQRYDDALAACGYDAVLIGAGIDRLQFMDDHHAPFRANPQLTQWLPLTAHPGSCLLYRPGQRPVAIVVRPESYWEEPPEAPGAPWADATDIRVVATPDDVPKSFGSLPASTALLGPAEQWDAMKLTGDRNPKPLVNHLHFQRACKTDYEIACMRSATAAAVAGHRAVADAFAAGDSEFGMLLIFQQASGQTATELPYPPIIGAGRHAAVLHYQHRRQQRNPAGSLLIDAGCNTLGYASDITRTHVLRGHDTFAELRDDLDARQQALCARVQPGVAFAELHHAAHEAIAGVLCRHGVLTCNAETAMERGLTNTFFPHGLGHLLGLQVHDVGGWQADAAGQQLEAPAAYPRLRLLRTLEPGFTLTVEPGIYFIDSLLEELRAQAAAADVNWDRVAEFHPYGGIRIEDNLLVTANGNENLTRAAFGS